MGYLIHRLLTDVYQLSISNRQNVRDIKTSSFFFLSLSFCLSLPTGFVELSPGIVRAGGKVIALSSQTPKQVGLASRDLKLPFQAHGDPSNGLVEEMNIR